MEAYDLRNHQVRWKQNPRMYFGTKLVGSKSDTQLEHPPAVERRMELLFPSWLRTLDIGSKSQWLITNQLFMMVDIITNIYYSKWLILIIVEFDNAYKQR